MKFVHIADMHFDVPFTSLSEKQYLCEKRRLKQRSALKKVIEYIKEEDIPYLFISGDLYEHDYVRKDTIDYINGLFKNIPNTKIFISPGNHDPYIRNSYYDVYDFADNVYIFRNSRIEKYEDENVNIFGMAFTDFYVNNSPLEKISIPYSNKINILISHLDLNGSRDSEGLSYNSILETKLNLLGFDYCAIGHIHKTNFNQTQRNCYPGSTIALGFDEKGKHGMIVGDISKNELKLEFVGLDDVEFKEINVDVENIYSEEALVEKIQEQEFDSQNIYKINLVGSKNIEISPRKLTNILDIDNLLKIEDCTSLSYNIEELASLKNLKGYFIREVTQKYKDGLCTEEEYKKAIEIGLNAM